MARTSVLLLSILSSFIDLADAQIAHVQSTSAGALMNEATISAEFFAQTAGNLNVVMISASEPFPFVESVTDSRGNVYQLAVAPTSLPGLGGHAIYYAKNIAASPPPFANTVTVVLDGNVPYLEIRIAEYSGIDPSNPLAGGVGATGNSATSDSGPLAVGTANVLLVAGSIVGTSVAGPGAGYTQRAINNSFLGVSHMLQDRIVTTTGSYNATASHSSAAPWVMQLAAFRAASGSDTQPPTTPTGLTATPVSSTQVNLSWTASTDNVAVTGYLVERCQGTSCTNFSEIATPTGTTHNDTGRSPSTTYRYRVRARDAVPNYSGYSSIMSATTPAAGDTQAPTAPTNLSATPVSSSQINLSWTASTDNVAVTGYLVERCQGASCTSFSQIATPAGTTHNDTGRSPSTTYRYRVRAQDAVPNFSSYSSIVSATTPAPDTQPPTAPTGLSVTAGVNQNLLTWTASTDNVGVTAYLIERCSGTGCSNFAQIDTSATTSYTDPTALAGIIYRYRVRARDAVPNFSGYSNIGSASPADCD
jgi:chitodextrinase